MGINFFSVFPFFPLPFTAFLRFTHLSVWVGWLSVVFSSVCYCPLEEISFGCLSVQKYNRYLTVTTFSRGFFLCSAHTKTQQSTSSPKLDTVTSPMTQKRVTRKSADFRWTAKTDGRTDDKNSSPHFCFLVLRLFCYARSSRSRPHSWFWWWFGALGTSLLLSFILSLCW